jgi:hypothetical protein
MSADVGILPCWTEYHIHYDYNFNHDSPFYLYAQPVIAPYPALFKHLLFYVLPRKYGATFSGLFYFGMLHKILKCNECVALECGGVYSTMEYNFTPFFPWNLEFNKVKKNLSIPNVHSFCRVWQHC